MAQLLEINQGLARDLEQLETQELESADALVRAEAGEALSPGTSGMLADLKALGAMARGEKPELRKSAGSFTPASPLGNCTVSPLAMPSFDDLLCCILLLLIKDK